MSGDLLRPFRQVWVVDFEFRTPPGDRPEPICMVAQECRTGQTLHLWADDLAVLDRPPVPIGPDAPVIAYYASAELGCFLALNWAMPARVLDLFCEFRVLTNGQAVPCGNGLLGALTYLGLPAIDAAEKDKMRNLALRGGPYSKAERTALLTYCESDVVALAKLLPKMASSIDLPRALLRGRYMCAVAAMEWTGIPIDRATLVTLRTQLDGIKADLVGRSLAGSTIRRRSGMRVVIRGRCPSSQSYARILRPYGTQRRPAPLMLLTTTA